MSTRNSLLDELSWRGMIYQQTDGLADALATSEISAYVGFDPTASSLHIGNLVPVMGLAHLQRAGHRPVGLVGGGTGLIGDPSGRTSERQLLSEEEIERNTRAIEKQLSHFLDFSGANAGQRRLVASAQGRGVHARRRQAFHRQLHAGKGIRAIADRGRDLVHRVLLHAAPGVRLSRVVPPRGCDASDGW